MDTGKYDLIVVGAGIVGLAHAYEAHQRGMKVAVVEQHSHCVGASVRNFGFVTVTGQRAGQTWQRAMRSRDVWEKIAPLAGIAIEHRGLWVLARDAMSVPVLEAFVRTEMGQACKLHTAQAAQELAPWLNTEGAQAAIYSPHELRVESRTALPKLAQWLCQSCGVDFYWGQQAIHLEEGQLWTTDTHLRAPHIVLCPGNPLHGLAKPWLDRAGITGLHLSRLQMLRVRPTRPLTMDSAVMSDLSLVRYRGYADLPEAQSLKAQLEQAHGPSLAHGIHLIAVQSADGSLVVGDSHHDERACEPFASETVDHLILMHLGAAVKLGEFEVVERWIGHYPTGYAHDSLVLAPLEGLRVVAVTSGTGASTAFGIAQDVMNEWN